MTLAERGGFEICPVCFWEDDGQDDPDADLVMGGPNGRLSRTQARHNFAAYALATSGPARLYAPMVERAPQHLTRMLSAGGG